MAGQLGNAAHDMARRRQAPSVAIVPAVGDATASPSEPAPADLRVPLALICRHPLNPRGAVDPAAQDVHELAASITELGVLQPLVAATRAAFTAAHPELVDQLTDDARWVLIAGERRFTAAGVAGLADVPVVDRSHLVNEGLDYEAMVVENIQREDLTPLQEARAYRRLTGAPHNLSQRAIAKRVGRNQSHIARRLSLLALPAEALLAVDAGELPIAAALVIAKDGNGDEELMSAAWKLITGPNPVYGNVDGAMRAAARRLEVTANIAKAKEQAEGEGLTFVAESELKNAWELVLHNEADIEKARAAGTLVVAVDGGGNLRYYDTTKGDRQRADEAARREAHREQQEQQEKARQNAISSRKQALAALIGKLPKQAELVDLFADYVIRSAAEADMAALELAMQMLGVDRDDDQDEFEWLFSLATKEAGVRRKAAWALALTQSEVNLSYGANWDADDEQYLKVLATAGYEQSDDDHERLAPLMAKRAAEQTETEGPDDDEHSDDERSDDDQDDEAAGDE